MSTNDIKHIAVETIYLVPDSSEGQRCYLWCDDPAPGLDMDPSESVEYLRKDVHDAIIAKQAKRLSAESSPAALESEREANARLTEQIAELEQERDALTAHVERLRHSIKQWNDGSVSDADMMALLFKWRASPADGSLTRRDLIKQSEALVALYNDCLGNGGDGMVRCAIMLDRAIELREEAEGHQ